MATKHHAELSASDRESRRRTKNQWMKILEAVFITLANIFRNLKIAKKEDDSHGEATSDFCE